MPQPIAHLDTCVTCSHLSHNAPTVSSYMVYCRHRVDQLLALLPGLLHLCGFVSNQKLEVESSGNNVRKLSICVACQQPLLLKYTIHLSLQNLPETPFPQWLTVLSLCFPSTKVPKSGPRPGCGTATPDGARSTVGLVHSPWTHGKEKRL